MRHTIYNECMARPTKLNQFNWRELGLTYASPEYYRLWREVNNEHSRVWHRKHDTEMYKKHPEREKARRERYRAKYPERIKANRKVAYALKHGKTIKQPCEVCKDIKAVAHHDDWDKPLDVKWLCELHHKARHRELLSLTV